LNQVMRVTQSPPPQPPRLALCDRLGCQEPACATCWWKEPDKSVKFDDLCVSHMQEMSDSFASLPDQEMTYVRMWPKSDQIRTENYGKFSPISKLRWNWPDDPMQDVADRISDFDTPVRDTAAALCRMPPHLAIIVYKNITRLTHGQKISLDEKLHEGAKNALADYERESSGAEVL
jgi:hypothetical protein